MWRLEDEVIKSVFPSHLQIVFRSLGLCGKSLYHLSARGQGFPFKHLSCPPPPKIMHLKPVSLNKESAYSLVNWGKFEEELASPHCVVLG